MGWHLAFSGANTRFRATGLILLAAAVTAWIFTRPGTPGDGYDWVELHVFHKHFYREALLAGNLPLWNPFVALGRPFAADIETAVFYPPNLVFLLPEAWALPLSVALHVCLILAGALLLGRELGLSPPASLLAGVTFALSAAVGGRLQAGQLQVFCTLAHAPLWWTLAWRAWRTPSLRPGSLFALVTASVVLAGSPPFLWAMGSALAIWLVAWSAGHPWRDGLRGAACLALSAALGLALTGVQLLPFLELVEQGNRPLRDAEFAQSGALPLRNLASLLVPSTSGFRFYWEMSLFAGVLAPLGVWGLAAAWKDRVARAFSFAALGGLLLALEPPLGLIGWLAPWVPGVGALRMPSRYALLTGWSLVMVALLLWQRRAENKRAGYGMLAAGAQLASLLWAVHVQSSHYAAAAPPAAESEIATAVMGFADRTVPLPPRVALARDAVRANAGVLHGFSNLEAFANPGLDRIWTPAHLLAERRPRTADRAQTAELALQPSAALQRWGVQFGWDTERNQFFLAPQAGPRAQAVYHYRIADNAHEAAQRWWQETPGTVVLEGEISNLPPAVAGAPPPRALAVTHYAPERVDVAWNSESAGWLVLAEPWYPGWIARVGDTEVEVRPANGWMRAVPVPAGSFTVRFEFQPRSLWWGAALTVVAALTFVLLLRLAALRIRRATSALAQS